MIKILDTNKLFSLLCTVYFLLFLFKTCFCYHKNTLAHSVRFSYIALVAGKDYFQYVLLLLERPSLCHPLESPLIYFPNSTYAMRPPSLVHRHERVVFRVYSLEKKAIALAAAKSGLSVSDYIRRTCLGKSLKARLTEEEISIYKLLIEYRNNFSRISNLVKANKDLTSELHQLIHSLDSHLKKFI